ncbi:hypothetical protein CATYP_09360 [Corynebacterium atypicum]|uniref:Lysoplasmalogenase n=1 Tax=Corynebacterium atypicum TaxID=191610 RepID=A0ABN4DEA6_9CORY|nr:hypothetical protein CATYP_09360 [Corynebacterium atypicum]
MRAAYVGCAAASVIAAGTGATRAFRWVKPALMPLLAASVASRPAQEPGTSGVEQAVLCAGLAGAWVGDLLLLRGPEGQRQLRGVNQAAAAFALNHAVYQVLLHRRGARLGVKAAAVRAGVWAAALGVTAGSARPALPAAAGYGALVAGTSALANDPALRGKGVAAQGLGHGGNLFAVSDALIAARLVLGRRGWLAARHWADRGLHAGVLATYVIAQLLLAEGLSR